MTPTDSQAARLKPCPFCNKPPTTTPSGEGGKGLMIECLTEGCVNPHVSYYNHDVARTAWNTRAPVASGDVKPAAYAVYGNAEGYGPVMLPEYVGSMEVIRNRVIANALREGFTGNFVERMAELGWWLEKLYATPRAAEAAVDEWRPIETAPRDGTRIIIGRPDSDGDGDGDGGISVCGYWLDELEDGVDYMGNDGGFTDVDYQVFYPSRSMGAKLSRYAGRQPTHWRPLPQPPALAAALGKSE